MKETDSTLKLDPTNVNAKVSVWLAPAVTVPRFWLLKVTDVEPPEDPPEPPDPPELDDAQLTTTEATLLYKPVRTPVAVLYAPDVSVTVTGTPSAAATEH